VEIRSGSGAATGDYGTGAAAIGRKTPPVRQLRFPLPVRMCKCRCGHPKEVVVEPPDWARDVLGVPAGGPGVA
jgi:hypothetical protein